MENGDLLSLYLDKIKSANNVKAELRPIKKGVRHPFGFLSLKIPDNSNEEFTLLPHVYSQPR